MRPEAGEPLICGFLIWIMRTGPFAFRDYRRISDRQLARARIYDLSAHNGGMCPLPSQRHSVSKTGIRLANTSGRE